MCRRASRGSSNLPTRAFAIPEYRLEVGSTDDPYVDHRRGDARHRQQAAIPADCRMASRSTSTASAIRVRTARPTAIPALSARQRLNALIQIVSQVPVPQVPGKASVRLPAIVAGDTTIRDVSARSRSRPARAGRSTMWSARCRVARRWKAKASSMLQGQPSFVGADHGGIQSAYWPCVLACRLGRSRDPAAAAGGFFRKC